jgi:CubicO group peptidase (beta-lactamase class C family)
VLDNAGHRLVVYRRPDKRDETSLDSETVVEVGSITKVLTALLLADMVERGEVALNDDARTLPVRLDMLFQESAYG